MPEITVKHNVTDAKPPSRETLPSGTYHAMMNFEVRAVSREAFAEYMQFRIDNPEASNAEALESIGEEPFAVSTSPFNSGRLDTRDMGQRHGLDHSADTITVAPQLQ